MTTPAPSRRRWFRFSLRTFFVLVAIFGVWLGVQVKWIRDRHEAVDRLRFGMEDGGSAPWSLRIFGGPGYKSVAIVVNDPDHPTADQQRTKREVERLFPEAEVYFGVEFHGWSGGFF